MVSPGFHRNIGLHIVSLVSIQYHSSEQTSHFKLTRTPKTMEYCLISLPTYHSYFFTCSSNYPDATPPRKYNTPFDTNGPSTRTSTTFPSRHQNQKANNDVALYSPSQFYWYQIQSDYRNYLIFLHKVYKSIAILKTTTRLQIQNNGNDLSHTPYPSHPISNVFTKTSDYRNTILHKALNPSSTSLLLLSINMLIKLFFFFFYFIV